MDTSKTYNDLDTTAATEHTTLAAAFADRDRAHDAIHRLHDEGFGETWLGITKAEESSASGTIGGETRVEADNWFMRFFGEGDESLRDALVRHGVTPTDASAAEDLAPNSAIVTVDGANHPELAAQIISECGGRMLTRGFGSTGYGTSGALRGTGSTLGAVGTGAALGAASAGTFASGRTTVAGATGADAAYDLGTETQPLTGASLGTVGNATDDRLATDAPLSSFDKDAVEDYGSYRGGKAIDADTRLQLREERLRIDKERRLRGEATISKSIVSQTQEVDVPLIHEELFIERRAVTGVASTSTLPIGSDTEVVRVNLTEEQLNVSKVAVVTEEVVVGKRQVEEIGHVSEKTRKEQLNVVDVDATATTSGSTLTDTRI